MAYVANFTNIKYEMEDFINTINVHKVATKLRAISWII